MKKWNFRQHRDDDRFEKFGKMGSKSRRAKSSRNELAEDFVLKEDQWPSIEGGFSCRIVEVHKRNCFVSPEPVLYQVDTHDVWMAKIAGKFYTADRSERNFFCVGDRVLCRPAEGREVEGSSDLPQAVILHMAPRTSRVARQDPMYPERDHVLASNVQSLIIVSSYLAPRVKWGLIDRYLVLAELQNIEPIIILNKLDLLNEAAAEHPDFVRQCHERTQYYRDLGYEVYSLQANAKKARSHAEIKRLMAKLSNRISMFSGHSGVGKSSLVNLLSPDIVQDVEPDSDIFYKGRHTTSYASFLGLGIGGYVIDTPGIRSFVIDRYGPIELSYGFREIRPFAEKCKFRECRHIDEPACAVLEAVESGVIVNWRYQHYRGILLGTSGREGRQRQDELSPEELEDLFGSDT